MLKSYFGNIVRFLTVFSHDNDSLPRVWTGNENIRTITKEARSAVIFNFLLCIGLQYYMCCEMSYIQKLGLHEAS